MKRIVSVILILTLSLTVLASCGSAGKAASTSVDKKIVVGASSTPHAEILEAIKSLVEEKGYTLDIKVFSDYVLPNTSLTTGDLDANFFQHLPYLEDFNKQNKADLVSVAGIHFEPFGIYSNNIKSLKELKDGDVVAVPNDTTNEARALLLLQDNGILKLKEGAGIEATVKDIEENPLNLKFKELEAAQIARSLPDVAIGVINGNYALQAGLSASKDAIVCESADSLAAKTYENILVVQKDLVEDEGIKILIEALKSDTCRKFIEETYDGSVVPTF